MGEVEVGDHLLDGGRPPDSRRRGHRGHARAPLLRGRPSTTARPSSPTPSTSGSPTPAPRAARQRPGRTRQRPSGPPPLSAPPRRSPRPCAARLADRRLNHSVRTLPPLELPERDLPVRPTPWAPGWETAQRGGPDHVCRRRSRPVHPGARASRRPSADPDALRAARSAVASRRSGSCRVSSAGGVHARARQSDLRPVVWRQVRGHSAPVAALRMCRLRQTCCSRLRRPAATSAPGDHGSLSRRPCVTWACWAASTSRRTTCGAPSRSGGPCSLACSTPMGPSRTPVPSSSRSPTRRLAEDFRELVVEPGLPLRR